MARAARPCASALVRDGGAVGLPERDAAPVGAMIAFGTDGVRGDTRRDLTAGLVQALGRAAAEVLGPGRIAIGRDPRASGPALAAALSRGVASGGGAPVDLGVLPTPAVARWCADEQAAGAMVSASHNPWHDNGVKLFSPGGRKLDDGAQDEIERRLRDLAEKIDPAAAAAADSLDGASGGPAMSDSGHRSEAARRRHGDAVVAGIEGRDLSGLHVVVDCAHGAAYMAGPDCLRRLSARVEAIHAAPDGYNINDGCGSLHPETLQAAVVSSGADAGVAFDGDADRVLAVDHTGALIDGDQILAVCAIDRARRGRLAGGAVVVTVMANLGLHRSMASHGIAVVETPVGDRHVLAALEERDLVLGGEQSGHLIFRDLATTGDGLLTAVQLLDTVKRTGRSLADLAVAAMTRVPQVLIGVPSPHPGRRQDLDLDAALEEITAAAAARLGDTGRVLVRPSGTEPVIRVMVEADEEAVARSEAERLSASVTEVLS